MVRQHSSCEILLMRDKGTIIQFLEQYPEQNRLEIIASIAEGLGFLHGKFIISSGLLLVIICTQLAIQSSYMVI